MFEDAQCFRSQHEISLLFLNAKTRAIDGGIETIRMIACRHLGGLSNAYTWRLGRRHKLAIVASTQQLVLLPPIDFALSLARTRPPALAPIDSVLFLRSLCSFASGARESSIEFTVPQVCRGNVNAAKLAKKDEATSQST